MPRFELLIDRVEDGIITLTNFSEVDVPLKTVLTSLYARDYRPVGETGWEASPETDAQPVRLTIESAEKFRRPLECIPRGYSAGIHVNGTGLEEVEKRLAGRGRRTQVLLGGE